MTHNVNVPELQKFVDAVKRDPAQARKEKMVEGNWNFQTGQPQFSAEIAYAKGKTTLNCELPTFTGGWGTSPDPIQYCLYGLAACFAVTFAATAASENIPLSELKVKAENRMDLRKQVGLSKDPIIQGVQFTVTAKSSKGRGELERLMKLAEERCPGSECVTRSIPLKVVLAPEATVASRTT